MTAPPTTAAEIADLVTRFTPLARAMATRFAQRCPALEDDFFSDSAFGLFVAARKFIPYPDDPTRRKGFVPFARRIIRWALLARLDIEQRKNPVTFERREAPILTADGLVVDAVALLPGDEPAPDAAAEYADDVADLERLLSTLDDRRREFVVRHIGDGATLATLGAERGVTRGAIFLNIKTALRRLREAAEAEAEE